MIDPVQYTSESKISNVWKLLVYLISLINLYSFVYLSVCSAFLQSDKFKSKSYNHKGTMPTRFSIWFSWYVYLYISIMKVRSFHLLHTELLGNVTVRDITYVLRGFTILNSLLLVYSTQKTTLITVIPGIQILQSSKYIWNSI